MTFTNERRITENIAMSLYNAEREIKEALNHGAQFSADFCEIYLTLARAKGQIEVLNCKFNATESIK